LIGIKAAPTPPVECHGVGFFGTSIMTRLTNVAAFIVLVASACLGPDTTSALPAHALALPAEEVAHMIQQAGWVCDSDRCQRRPGQSTIRITGGQRGVREFLTQLTPLLNCCHPAIVPFYGYSYGPEISFGYGHRTPVGRHAGY
jgi:hypothetical protein